MQTSQSELQSKYCFAQVWAVKTVYQTLRLDAMSYVTNKCCQQPPDCNITGPMDRRGSLPHSKCQDALTHIHGKVASGTANSSHERTRAVLPEQILPPPVGRTAPGCSLPQPRFSGLSGFQRSQQPQAARRFPARYFSLRQHHFVNSKSQIQRRQIFWQVKQKAQRILCVFASIFVTVAGKSASEATLKASAVNCAVLP